jgi:hypothetical protein
VRWWELAIFLVGDVTRISWMRSFDFLLRPLLQSSFVVIVVCSRFTVAPTVVVSLLL